MASPTLIISKNLKLKKIAIVGPESTGKSELTLSLARHFGCLFVPEVARVYLENLNRPYRMEDVEHIARLQLEEEDRISKQAEGILICDTTLLVIKIWMLHAYGRCPDWILESIATRPYDLHLLTDVDLPWRPDPLREHPDLREFFKSWYKSELTGQRLAWKLVYGLGEERTERALLEILHHFGDF